MEARQKRSDDNDDSAMIEPVELAAEKNTAENDYESFVSKVELSAFDFELWLILLN